MLIADVMTLRVVSVQMDDRLSLVKDIFDQAPFHHLLVLDDEELTGVISERDLLRAISPYFGSAAELPRDRETVNRRAHQIMTRHPFTVTSSCTVEQAAEEMLEQGIGCFPVVDGVAGKKRIKGIVTWKDLMSVLLIQHDES